MSNLMMKEEEIKTTPIYLGYKILKLVQNKPDSRLSIFELIEKLKREFKIVHYRQIILALTFLYVAGVVDFTEPYIYSTTNED